MFDSIIMSTITITVTIINIIIIIIISSSSSSMNITAQFGLLRFVGRRAAATSSGSSRA